MAGTAKQAGPRSDAGVKAILVGAAVLAWLAVAGAAKLGGVDTLGQNWVGIPLGLAMRRTSWTRDAWWWLGGEVLLLGALAFAVTWLVAARRGKRSRVDDAAKLMGHGRDVERASRRHAEQVAAKLGVVADEPGFLVGRNVADSMSVYITWEDTALVVAGPRVGKTTSLAIPWTVAAPGMVVVTSNKRDLVDATRDVRAGVGRVWVFDPEHVVEEPQRWYWPVLTYVTDDQHADQLAGHFVFSVNGKPSGDNAYFVNAARNLLSDLMLAAALSNEPVTTVLRWLYQRKTPDPALTLRRAGYALRADRLVGTQALAPAQQDGVYDTASTSVACLSVRDIQPWVMRMGPDDQRDAFDPTKFVTGRNSLYSVSKEGTGVSAPLVTALTVAVAEAAEKQARRSPGGRLATPGLFCLDEAANVCKWEALPSLYSFYGSMGLVMATFLQSWPQGVRVWGEDGMRMLGSSANMFAYLGGVRDKAYLEELAALIGSFDRRSVSTSQGRDSSSHSVSVQTTRELIMTVDELAALPMGRAIVQVHQARPQLVQTVPWFVSNPHQDGIKASLKAHDPASK